MSSDELEKEINRWEWMFINALTVALPVMLAATVWFEMYFVTVTLAIALLLATLVQYKARKRGVVPA